jgi:magnesium transporter
VLRPTPGALNSHLLEERPANLPAHLYVSGGRHRSCFSAVLFEPEGPRLISLHNPAELQKLHGLGYPLWLRVMGLGDPKAVEAMLDTLQVPRMLLPPLLEGPQRSRAVPISVVVRSRCLH